MMTYLELVLLCLVAKLVDLLRRGIKLQQSMINVAGEIGWLCIGWIFGAFVSLETRQQVVDDILPVFVGACLSHCALCEALILPINVLGTVVSIEGNDVFLEDQPARREFVGMWDLVQARAATLPFVAKAKAS